MSARIFGVSRPVIREALVGLQSLGLVVYRNGRGTFIASRQINPDLLLGIDGAGEPVPSPKSSLYVGHQASRPIADDTADYACGTGAWPRALLIPLA
jgi:Bacterial regulatory proteins, gntR family